MQFKASFINNPTIRQRMIYLAASLLILNIWVISNFFGQSDFFFFFPYYTIAFLSWFCVMQIDLSAKQIYIIGIMARFVLIFSFPTLSDDIYRFYWDGKLTLSGISPYGILPSEALNQRIPYLDTELFDQLNSKLYYTIYPPISQLYFAISSAFGNIIVAAIVMKGLFIFTETLGLYYLIKNFKKVNIPIKTASIYFLNPLVIIEGTGNLHFEVLMISFLCISIYYLFNSDMLKGAFFLAISIGIKLLPLMVLPYFWFRLKNSNRWKLFACLSLFILLIFLPVANGVMASSFMKSVDLYFRKFEFNASIYYIFRYLGQQISGYNLISFIGPLLALSTLAYNVYVAFSNKMYSIKDFTMYALLVWTAYLIFATTIHPWYVISLLFFTQFGGLKHPFIWSYLVILSYINYSYPIYYENMWWIALEYTLLFGWMYWERTNSKNILSLKSEI